MNSESDAHYITLGQLIIEMPDFSGYAPLTAEQDVWLGRACAFVDASGVVEDAVTINLCAQSMNTELRPDNVREIAAILHRALARAVLPS